MTVPRIVAFAYACTPAVGSEAGSGWAWAELLASFADVWVLTRPYPFRRAAIDAHLPDVPHRDRIRVLYVDLPRLGGLGRSPRLLRHGYRLQYLIWQISAFRVARRLHREIDFDLAWHLTFSNVWMGSLASLIGPRFVYGPVGGGVGPPWRLATVLGWRGLAYEAARSLGRMAGRFLNPVARLSWQRADVILAQNPETRAWFPANQRHKVEVFHNIVLQEEVAPPQAARSVRPLALFAGRLLPLKGVSLAIQAMRNLPGWRFVICGEGPDEKRLRNLARRMDLQDRVEFHGWVERSQVLKLMREANVLLFPSLHEEGGWVVAEAIASGLPVVALDRGGPPTLGARTVKAGWPRDTVRSLADEARAAFEAGSPPAVEALSLEARRERLMEVLVARHLLKPDVIGHPGPMKVL